METKVFKSFREMLTYVRGKDKESTLKEVAPKKKAPKKAKKK